MDQRPGGARAAEFKACQPRPTQASVKAALLRTSFMPPQNQQERTLAHPRAGLIDLGNVIAPFDHVKGARQVAELGVNGLTTQMAFDFFFGGPNREGINRAYELGNLSTDEFWESARRELDLGCRREDFEQAWKDIFTIDRAVVDQLQSWSERFPLYLCSNTNPLHWERILELDPGVKDLFSGLFLSYEMGYLKPDEAYFHQVLDRLALDPGRCLFIDDMAPNIESARRLGIRAVRFEGLKPLQEALPL
jgi:HAD superfamily hydrolase (TIGR01509 family)